MKRFTQALFFVLLSSVSLSAQCTLACFADVNVSLDVFGNASITPYDVLASYGPACGALTVSPSTFDCSDIGAPIVYTVTDPLTGNTCFGNIHVEYKVMAMACFADINIKLGPSGVVVLTPDMLLAEPPADCIPGAIINPPTLSCSDIGAPVFVTITDPVSGNSCWSNVNVTFDVGAMSCFADINVKLGPSGSLTLEPDMLLADPPGDCIPGAIISPSSVDCSDVGSTIFTTITDPVGGNSCWSNITVDDPRPSSCNIVSPPTITCGASGVPFSVNVVGGYGPFQYDWKIKGNPKGWSIQSGQGTPNITMQAGDKKINLEVTITDLCGKKRKCSVKPDCTDPMTSITYDQKEGFEHRSKSSNSHVEVYPVPAHDVVFLKGIKADNIDKLQLSVFNQLGQRQNVEIKSNLDDGSISLWVQNLVPGVYWIASDNGMESFVYKMVKK